VRLRIFTEPQFGFTYDDQLAAARTTEEEGFDAFFRSDHYLTMAPGDGEPGPTDSWITLAGLARETSRIRLGTLVTSATFRLPGPLAIYVAQVDAMSGGRAELGLGAGWFDAEHRAYGIPFPPTRERFERLEEQLEILTGLWGTPPGTRYAYAGKHYSLEDSPALPKPLQSPRPTLIVGGAGAARTPRLAARFADEFNTPFLQPRDAQVQYGRVLEACEKAGREPSSMRLSAAVTVCCGVDDVEVARRAERIGQPADALRAFGACGRPDEVADRLSEWVVAGAETLYLQLIDLTDLDHIRLIAREVAPLLP
jgi:F420-dependent oxidoreductase-like protein